MVLIDPPWKMNVKVDYDRLKDEELVNSLPLFKLLDDDGLLFIWLVNAKLAFTMDWLRDLGFVLVDTLAWFKLTQTNARPLNSYGYYLRHSKELCFLFKKGRPTHKIQQMKVNDSIVSQFTDKSEKPLLLYEMIHTLVPSGHFLEIFARTRCIRNGWVSIGNEFEDGPIKTERRRGKR